MLALFFIFLLGFHSVRGQSSPLNKYHLSKGVQLMYLFHSAQEVKKEAVAKSEDCASLCSPKSDCRAFNFNWQFRSCELLPWTEHSANIKTHQNVYSALYQKKEYMKNCIVGKGENYRGRKHVTENGITCQHWKSKFPHDHRYSFTTKNGLEENYCRNPDGDETGPWCYTINGSIRHESCGIKKCDVDVCVICNGEDYRGFVDYTKSGRECQRWDMQFPHKHHYQPEKYPEKGLNDNYCRNPDGSVHPWCYTTDPNMEREYCNIHKCKKQRLRNVEFTTKCFKQHGVGYRGTVNTTTSGIPCQRWDSQTPHQHEFLPENYECKGLEENYCRNPDGSEAPWCFTTLPEMRVAFCLQIKRCPEDIDAEDCYHGNGKVYNGKVAKTRKGITCQKWTDEEPHKSKFSPKTHPEDDLQENYCRNPDGDSHGPWCYTIDPKTTFDYCAIKPCAGDIKPSIIEAPDKIAFDECGKRSDRIEKKARIVGGRPGNSPWSVSLRNRDGIHFCGGSLVGTEWIISTRQCFTSCDLDPQKYEAWLGTLFTKPDANDPQKQVIPISKIFCGPAESYLVMLKLARHAELNTRVALICLPPEKYIVPEGTKCEIAGWGDTRGTGYENQLKVAELKVLSNKECKRVKENEMCTHPVHLQTGACEGDYGGPLACFTHDCWVLEGVIIPSRGCGKANQPGIYIRVSIYVDWIQKVMQIT